MRKKDRNEKIYIYLVQIIFLLVNYQSNNLLELFSKRQKLNRKLLKNIDQIELWDQVYFTL